MDRPEHLMGVQSMTDPAHRGQGLASALVIHAANAAHGAGASMVFLVADAEDWVQHIYRRLGFTDLGRTASLRAEPSTGQRDF
jgi:ribosomal protein S18 acetylase RimI-like enzyme